MKTLNCSWLNVIVCILFISISSSSYSQGEADEKTEYKNQVSTNLLLPIFESFDLTYEHTIANKWAIGVAGGIYGDRIREISTRDSYYKSYDTNYEIMPFVRLYFQGTQNKSHFLEVFGSISDVEESDIFVRNTNEEGFGVYEQGTNSYTAGGFGFGYGYRFLLPNNKWVLEAQLGIRTNFDTNFFVLDATLVRTGIKVGYRF